MSMITIQSHISKLDALRLYMDCWIAEQSLRITLWDMYNTTGMFCLPPTKLPPFDTWYKIYQSTYN